MPKNILVVIRENPRKSHKASEALRIALGLSTGPNPLKVLLTGQSKLMLTEDAYDLPDGDMLEKYLPTIQSLEIPLFLDQYDPDEWPLDKDFSTQTLSESELVTLVKEADRVLIF